MPRSWAALAGLALAGCAAPEPTITVVEPADGATVCGQPLMVEMAVTEFEIVGFDEPTAADGASGHIDVTLNGQTVAMVLDPAFAVEVDDGAYQLEAELVTSEHESLDPPVSDVVRFTVDSTTCSR